jgi:RNA polymerase sigma factor (TIGR02999 family)
MSELPSGDVTALLKEWSAGDASSLDRLVPVVYEHLHRMAGRFMRAEDPDNSLQATALVNEAYLRLIDITDVTWQDRAHFFAVSAQMMRRILVDAARARRSEKRGGAFVKIELHESIDVPAQADELVALDDALSALAAFDERKARVVEMKFFAGLSVEETAAVLKISPRSVERDWTFARAWLMRELAP